MVAVGGSALALVFGILVLLSTWSSHRTAAPPRSRGPEPGSDLTERTRQAAERGNPEAQDAYGFALMKGRGVASNPAEAVEWYRKAANQGYWKSDFNLGIAYSEGLGVAVNLTEAANHYRRAAEHGHALAQNNLASAYSKGAGVPKDPAEAVVWYRKAANQGFPPSEFMLGGAYLKGYGIPNDDVEAVTWFKKAALHGHAEAQYNLAVALSKGQGTPRDKLEAWAWLKVASRTSRQVAGLLDKFGADLTPTEAESARLRALELENEIDAHKLSNQRIDYPRSPYDWYDPSRVKTLASEQKAPSRRNSPVDRRKKRRQAFLHQKSPLPQWQRITHLIPDC